MIIVNAEYAPDESYRQLAHAAWNGWTFADTIFPCFLFIVGVSLALSISSRMVRGQSQVHLLAHAMRRALLIFACGVAIDYLRFPSHDYPFVGLQAHLQLTGVLQKIAVCYLVAFVIFLWTGLRGVIVGIIGLNLLYLALLYFYPVPGCGPGSLVEACNFPGYADEVVLDGFRWNSTSFDPDGVGSILPAITSVLFGVLAGLLLLRQERRPQQRLLQLLWGGLILIAAGELLSTWVPINKHLWTTSFAVLMAGLATTALVCVVWLVEGRPFRRWLRPLEIFWVERDRRLLNLAPRGKRASGTRQRNITLRRRPYPFGQPAECVSDVCDGRIGCRLLRSLAHGSTGLASKILVRQPAKRTFDEPAYRTGFMSTRTRAQAVAQTAAAHCRRRSSASARREDPSASI